MSVQIKIKTILNGKSGHLLHILYIPGLNNDLEFVWLRFVNNIGARISLNSRCFGSYLCSHQTLLQFVRFLYQPT